MAVQLWVLRSAGLDVRDAGVLTLNREYVYDGVRLDLHSLFELHPVFDEACALLDTIGGQVREMQAMLAQPAAPDIAPGEHRFIPYECPYHAHCTGDQFMPDHGIGELPRLTAQRRIQLDAAGIEEIRDVPAEFPLTPLQRIVRRTVREGRALVHDDLPSALAGIVPPVRHLDFETFAPAIPRFAGTRPYDAIPFLFSVHTEHGGSPLGHIDYLHDHEDDPRPRLAERLLAALGHKGTICTYSGYERRVLRALEHGQTRTSKHVHRSARLLCPRYAGDGEAAQCARDTGGEPIDGNSAMKLVSDKLILAPTDFSHILTCRHLACSIFGRLEAKRSDRLASTRCSKTESGDGVGERWSCSRGLRRSAVGSDHADRVIHPGNGAMIQENQSPENPARFTSMTHATPVLRTASDDGSPE